MTDKIEIYVKKQKQLAGQHASSPISDGAMNHTCLSKNILDYENVLPENEKQTLDFIKQYAETRNIILEIIDTSTLKGRLRANIRQIKETPTITIGQTHIQPQPNLQQLREKLEQHLKTPET